MKIFHFAIPVAPRRDAEQWARVNELLALTLGSIRNQSDDRYVIHVCAHERPAALDDPANAAVRFIQVDFPRPADDRTKRRDKRQKRWQIARAVREMGGGYFMHMDADDLVHRDLVRYILGDHNENGYVIREGYALDFGNRRVAPIPGAFRKGFNRVCGSSGVMYLLPGDLPSMPYNEKQGTTLFERITSHKYYEDGNGRKDRPLTSVPFPAGVYMLNNGVNLSNILVRTEERQLELIRGIADRAFRPIDTPLQDPTGLDFVTAFGVDPSFFAGAVDALASTGTEGIAASLAPSTARRQNTTGRPRVSEQAAAEAIAPHAKQLAAALNYLEPSGWLQSARVRRPVDADGNPLPWYTYAAIAFLATRVRKDLEVFEFGSGNSTLWWADRVASVTSVEHLAEWAAIVRPDLPDNAQVQIVPLEADGDYARAALTSGRLFDVIVIHGRDRINCARHSLSALKPGGVMIWDNTERRRYRSGYEALTEAGFRRLNFRGLAPIRGKEVETTIFYRPDNCLGI
jgi:predicted O-methyltransferase YrrM